VRKKADDSMCRYRQQKTKIRRYAGGRLMRYVNITIDLNDVASSLTEDAINIGELMNELGDHYGDTLGRAAYDILEGMGKEGRHFVRLLAAAIEAEGE